MKARGNDVGEKRETRPDAPRMRSAICIAGNARLFANPDVQSTYMGFVEGLRAQTTVDLFAYLTLQGAGPKNQINQQSWNFDEVNADERNVTLALERLGTAQYWLQNESANVTESNVHEFIESSESQSCFQRGFWKETGMLVRSVAQLSPIQACFRLVQDYAYPDSKLERIFSNFQFTNILKRFF